MSAMNNTELDDTMAAMLAPSGTRYILACRECRVSWNYKRDCKTTKAARDGRATCPDCGDALELIVDPKEDED